VACPADRVGRDSEFLGVVTTSPELRRQVAQTGPPDELTLTLNVA
jgi:hypothetical protein